MDPMPAPAEKLQLIIQDACKLGLANVEAMSHKTLLSRSITELAEEIVDIHVPRPLELHLDDLSGRPSDFVLEVQQDAVSSKTVRIPTVAIFVDIPFSGERALFDHPPSNTVQRRPAFEFSSERLSTGNYVTLTIAGTNLQHPDVEQALRSQLEQITAWVQAINDDITRTAEQVYAEVSSALTDRQTRYEQAGAMLAVLDIPARKIASGQALEIPAKRKAISMTSTSPKGAAEREWTLSGTLYEQIISTITRTTTTLERVRRTTPLLAPKEETIRDVLLVLLNGAYDDGAGGELFIAGEVFNGKGKTDILVRHRDRNVFIGECKFWTGPAKFTEAIDQLLGYTVWRDTKAALVLFIKNKKPTVILDKADTCIRHHPQFRSASTPDEPDRRRDYTLASPEDQRRLISMALIPVVIPAAWLQVVGATAEH